MRKVDHLTVIYAQEGKNPIRLLKILIHLGVGWRVKGEGWRVKGEESEWEEHQVPMKA